VRDLPGGPVGRITTEKRYRAMPAPGCPARGLVRIRADSAKSLRQQGAIVDRGYHAKSRSDPGPCEIAPAMRRRLLPGERAQPP